MGKINDMSIIERGCIMHTNNVNFAALSTEELSTLEKFEKEFASKHGSKVFLLAFNTNK
ncbi:MAG TPA: hypothetical protein VN379_09990 [Sporomusa sp.]|nr:hypothetical protein [Sporomusa sp.]